MAAFAGLAAALLALATAGGEGPGAQAYTLVAPRWGPATADGRYTLVEASARVEAEPATPDGRFKLIEIRQPAVGCDPFPEELFANGFE